MKVSAIVNLSKEWKHKLLTFTDLVWIKQQHRHYKHLVNKHSSEGGTIVAFHLFGRNQNNPLPSVVFKYLQSFQRF